MKAYVLMTGDILHATTESKCDAVYTGDRHNALDATTGTVMPYNIMLVVPYKTMLLLHTNHFLR